MKNVKLLLATGVLFVLSLGVAFGQASNKNKTVYQYTYSEWGNLICNGDEVIGDIKQTITYWNGKVQLNYKGVYYGIYSGMVYEWSLVENRMVKDWVEGQADNYTDTFNSVVYCDGEPFARYKGVFHYTINANGEITSWTDKGTWGWECF